MNACNSRTIHYNVGHRTMFYVRVSSARFECFARQECWIFIVLTLHFLTFVGGEPREQCFNDDDCAHSQHAYCEMDSYGMGHCRCASGWTDVATEDNLQVNCSLPCSLVDLAVDLDNVSCAASSEYVGNTSKWSCDRALNGRSGTCAPNLSWATEGTLGVDLRDPYVEVTLPDVYGLHFLGFAQRRHTDAQLTKIEVHLDGGYSQMVLLDAAGSEFNCTPPQKTQMVSLGGVRPSQRVKVVLKEGVKPCNNPGFAEIFIWGERSRYVAPLPLDTEDRIPTKAVVIMAAGFSALTVLLIFTTALMLHYRAKLARAEGNGDMTRIVNAAQHEYYD